jgi:hypothetical protein
VISTFFRSVHAWFRSMRAERGINAATPVRFRNPRISRYEPWLEPDAARRLNGLTLERLSEKSMPKGKNDDRDRPSEDDVAQERLGGPRGSPQLKPAPMTRQRRIKTPENDPESGSGHTA